MNRSPLKYYSQNGEDYLLWKFFNEKKRGFYIDVGAFDGIYLSNTFLFGNLGWDGICIEPHPETFSLLKKNRYNSINFNCACIDDESISFVVLNMENMGYLSTIDNSDEREQDIKERYKKRGFTFEGFQKTTVKAITLNSILKQRKITKKIDFLKIDVEGAELKVLEGFDIKKYQPRVIVLEANTSDSEKELKDYLEEKDYFYVGRLGENIFFVRDKKDLAKMENIPINCVITEQVHPLDPKYSVKSLLVGKTVNTKLQNNDNEQNKDGGAGSL